MVDKIPLEDILFLDIETVPESDDFSKLNEVTKLLWEEKTRYQRKDDFTPETFYEKAGIWAEFGKIICISVGYFNISSGLKKFRVTSFYGEEKQILLDFKNLLQSHFNQYKHKLCGHNSKEFDIPFIARRMIIHNITLPDKLNLFGKKPWEIPHLDTMDLWKFGDYKHFTSLKLLTHVLGIPTPKDDISGDKVRQVYYEENDLDRIVSYCEKDTIAVAQLLLKLQNKPLLEIDEILHL
jgi:uncharacterized protein YprB with RNaseH-like and TPR domain